MRACDHAATNSVAVRTKSSAGYRSGPSIRCHWAFADFKVYGFGRFGVCGVLGCLGVQGLGGWRFRGLGVWGVAGFKVWGFMAKSVAAQNQEHFC